MEENNGYNTACYDDYDDDKDVDNDDDDYRQFIH